MSRSGFSNSPLDCFVESSYIAIENCRSSQSYLAVIYDPSLIFQQIELSKSEHQASTICWLIQNICQWHTMAYAFEGGDTWQEARIGSWSFLPREALVTKTYSSRQKKVTQRLLTSAIRFFSEILLLAHQKFEHCAKFVAVWPDRNALGLVCPNNRKNYSIYLGLNDKHFKIWVLSPPQPWAQWEHYGLFALVLAKMEKPAVTFFETNCYIKKNNCRRKYKTSHEQKKQTKRAPNH